MRLKHIHPWLIVVASLLGFMPRAAANDLEKELQLLLQTADARIGIAVVYEGKVVARVNDKEHYPLMSVFKFHQGMAVAHSMEQRNIPIDSAIYVSRQDLRENTYSPLRDKFPAGNFRMPISELLQYSVQQSDNNACDILFRHFGGPSATDRYIRSLGFKHFNIQHTEDEMHQDVARCQENWSRPSEAALLMYSLFHDPQFKGAAFDFLRLALEQCQTGTDRIAAPLLSTNAVVAHKTGTGDPDASGRLVGINDVAHIRLSNGKQYAIAVLVGESGHNMSTTSRLIAQASNIVFRWIIRQEDKA